MTRREMVIAVLCVLVCGAFVVRNLLSSGPVSVNAGPEARQRLLEGKIREVERLIARGPAYDKRLQQLAVRIGTVSSDGVEMSGIAARLESLARQSKVRIANIKPLDVQDSRFYRRYPVEVSVDGEWSAIAQFLYLAQDPEDFLDVERMKIDKYGEQVAAKIRGRVTFSKLRVKIQER